MSAPPDLETPLADVIPDDAPPEEAPIAGRVPNQWEEPLCTEAYPLIVACPTDLREESLALQHAYTRLAADRANCVNSGMLVWQHNLEDGQEAMVRNFVADFLRPMVSTSHLAPASADPS